MIRFLHEQCRETCNHHCIGSDHFESIVDKLPSEKNKGSDM